MKQRLDQLLVERGLVETRSKAQAIIMAGHVFIDGQKASKAGEQVGVDSEISLKEFPKYVSRGGDKLASVANHLGVSFSGKTVLDVGSSTGGFTDFALQHGAAKVFAVDVGNAQLHHRLRQNPHVEVLERTDIRDLKLPQKVDLATVDVSFISLSKILPVVKELVSGEIIALAKPQFEADKATADRFKGVIKDETVRQKILTELESKIKGLGFDISASQDSAVHGSQGNRERFYKLLARH